MFTTSFLTRIPLISIILLVSAAAVLAQSTDRVWREVDDSNFKERPASRFAVPGAYKTFRLNKGALRAILETAPLEFETIGLESKAILTMPMPDGTFERFAIKESPIMEPGLAEKFPEFRTFLGQGIDNPTATSRFDLMPNGFHSIILSDQGTIYVDPYSKSDTANYISFNKASLRQNPNPFVCEVGLLDGPVDLTASDYKLYTDSPNVVTNGATLRQYRLALAATNEYAVAVGGNTVAGALAAQVVVMNRVNGVYERELAIRMNIIANNNLIVYAGDNVSCGGPCNAGNDPYTNSSGGAMLGQNQTNVDTVIMTANYDIGHVFSTGGGGVATLQSPCNPATKARGVTGLPTPIGDPFAIDFVAHEMGHQFGGSHTFNGSSGNCSGGNRSASNAFEPSSGSTIQAYAGICSPQNLQLNSNDYFHVRSLEQMVTFAGAGGNCSANSATGNTPPSISVVGGTTFNIPADTPFELTGSGSDINGDAVTYNWEEYDLGPADPVGQPASATADAPVFRTYPATTSPSRFFPSIQYILNNNSVPPSTYNCGGPTCVTGEVLPAITRSMTFQVTARDNRAGGGGVNSTTATVNIDANSGPFKVTAQDTLAPNWEIGTMQTVTWNVANTTNAPVSAANVDILLSTDGGNTFPITLLASTPNDGTQQITVPNNTTNMARLKVQGTGNIFFDISNVNFRIVLPPTAASASVAGRVTTSSGRGISRAGLTLLNTQTNEVQTVFTNNFGFYKISEVTVGSFYILTINDSKGFSFPDSQRSFSLNDSISGLNFLGVPN